MCSMTAERLMISSLSPWTGADLDGDEFVGVDADKPNVKDLHWSDFTADTGMMSSLKGFGSARVARRRLWQAVSSSPRRRRQLTLWEESSSHKRDSRREERSSSDGAVGADEADAEDELVAVATAASSVAAISISATNSSSVMQC